MAHLVRRSSTQTERIMPTMRSNRRGFLGTLSALLGTAALQPEFAAAEPMAGGWDMSWLDRLKGKHKQVFDLGNTDALGVVKNWLNAHEEVYGLKSPDVNAVVGIGGHTFPVNAGDALYTKYPIGELWKVTDPATSKPATRNIFLDGGDTPAQSGAKVKALQARGVIFWQCNNALHGVAGRIAEAVKAPEPEVYEVLKAGLNPGVILVPAHTMLIGLCQERGCAYESL
jgi:hypothetical protein